MRRKVPKSFRRVVRERLLRRAEQRVLALEPSRGQMRAAKEEDGDGPVFINKPTDPNGYGAGILIRDGRLTDAEIEELIEAYGEEFFWGAVWPHLRG